MFLLDVKVYSYVDIDYIYGVWDCMVIINSKRLLIFNNLICLF